MTGAADFPSDVELGLEPMDEPDVPLRCGCTFPRDVIHDEDDCLEGQADLLAEMERGRR